MSWPLVVLTLAPFGVCAAAVAIIRRTQQRAGGAR